MLRARKSGLGWSLEIRRRENHKPQTSKKIHIYIYFKGCISENSIQVEHLGFVAVSAILSFLVRL